MEQGCFPTITTISAHRDRYSGYRVYAVHGLNGTTRAWTSAKDHYQWLNHLARWLKMHGGHSVDVSLVGWNTQIMSHSNISTQIRSDVRQLAKEIMKQYGEKNDIRPSREGPALKQKIIFIGHSMGGILIRALFGWMHQESGYSDFLSRIEGLILLASPSEGSTLANYSYFTAIRAISPGMSMFINPSHLKDLKPGSKELEEINTSFAAYCKSRDGQRNVESLKIACLVETTKEMGIVRIVDPKSADVPKRAAGHVRWETERLEGLSHSQVTEFTRQQVMSNDSNLRKIVKQFLRLQGVRRNMDQINLATI